MHGQKEGYGFLDKAALCSLLPTKDWLSNEAPKPPAATTMGRAASVAG